MLRASADADQEAALQAVREASERCFDHLQTLASANARIDALARSGDPLWSRMAVNRYNQTCRERGDNTTPTNDDFLIAIRSSMDLKTVCDTRWLLGEAVDVLRDRLGRLGSIAAPFDDFERSIRQAVTGPDRSPGELAASIEHAILLGTKAIGWVPKTTPQAPLVDRWKYRLQNNPVVAAILIGSGVLTSTLALYDAVKDPLGLTAKSRPAREGWAIAGWLDPDNPRRWSRQQVDIIEASPATDRRYPIRKGDIVEPRVALEAWIVDYQTSGRAKLLTPPIAATYAAPHANQTGHRYAAHARFAVVGVRRTPVAGEDDVLWVRLSPQ